MLFVFKAGHTWAQYFFFTPFHLSLKSMLPVDEDLTLQI